MYILDCYFFLSINLIHIKHSMTFLFWQSSIIAQHVFTSTQSASPRDWDFELYLCFFIYSSFHSLIHIFFTIIYVVSLYLIYINQVWHFCLKSFNNSPACIYFHSKCPSPQRLSLKLYLCYIYLFIHSLIVFFFYYYLFVHLI